MMRMTNDDRDDDDDDDDGQKIIQYHSGTYHTCIKSKKGQDSKIGARARRGFSFLPRCRRMTPRLETFKLEFFTREEA